MIFSNPILIYETKLKSKNNLSFEYAVLKVVTIVLLLTASVKLILIEMESLLHLISSLLE